MPNNRHFLDDALQETPDDEYRSIARSLRTLGKYLGMITGLFLLAQWVFKWDFWPLSF